MSPTAGRSSVPLQDMVKRLQYGQEEIACLLVDIFVATCTHEELRSFDAQGHLVQGIQSFFPELSQTDGGLSTIRLH